MSTPPSRNSAHADSDATGHLQVPGQHADVVHRLKNVPGYTTPVFKGKEEQRAKVQATVAAKVRSRLSAFSLSLPALPPGSTLLRCLICKGGDGVRALTAFGICRVHGRRSP